GVVPGVVPGVPGRFHRAVTTWQAVIVAVPSGADADGTGSAAGMATRSVADRDHVELGGHRPELGSPGDRPFELEQVGDRVGLAVDQGAGYQVGEGAYAVNGLRCERRAGEQGD